MSNYTSPKTINDLLGRYLWDEYCFGVVELATDVDVLIGTPLDANGGTAGYGGLVTNGNESNVDAISLQKITHDSATNFPCLCLRRGPAMINQDQLELETSVTAAELEPYLNALGIRYIEEPEVTSTQSV